VKGDEASENASSLLKFIDRTLTPMGRRSIRSLICNPSRNLSRFFLLFFSLSFFFHSFIHSFFNFAVEINGRLDAVEILIKNPTILDLIRNFLLKRKVDLDRRVSKAHYLQLSVVDFVALLKEVIC
jgi:DNA mismatch repair ATPase MutS